jgi:serine/threonine protein kinase
LKPENIMIGSFGEVLVLDWGVAKVMGTPAADGLRVGTPGFMAPEQERGDTADVGPRADIFALGAILGWMIDGDPPAPKRLRAIIAKCGASAASDRYADASELAADLAAEREGLAVSAYRDTWLDHASRWFVRYRTFIVLVVAYLVMRTLFALWRR